MSLSTKFSDSKFTGTYSTRPFERPAAFSFFLLAACVPGASTSKITRPFGREDSERQGIRYARESKPAPRITTCSTPGACFATMASYTCVRAATCPKSPGKTSS